MANDEKADSSKDQTPKVPPRQVDPLLNYAIMKQEKLPDKAKSTSKANRKGT